MAAPRQLPPPEWFDDFRRLHLDYEREYERIRSQRISEDEKRALASDLWLKTNEQRKALERQAPSGLSCTALKANGECCPRPAMRGYIGQMCSAHAPPVSDWPELEETRRIWDQRRRELEG